MNLISQNKIADSALEYIKPPIKIKNPEESGGYNEWESYKSFGAGAEFAIRELENISIEFAEWLVGEGWIQAGSYDIVKNMYKGVELEDEYFNKVDLFLNKELWRMKNITNTMDQFQ